MKNNTHIRSGFIISLCFMLLFLFLACSTDPDILENSSHELSSGTGSISFQVTWMEIATGTLAGENRSKAAQAVEDICSTDVTLVAASVYNQANELLADGGPWECEVHQGRISNIPAGDNRKLVVYSLDSNGNILHRGEHSGIPVTEGERYEIPQPIECNTMIPTLLRPSDDSAVSDSGLKFEWSLSQQVNANQYQIQISGSDDFSTTIVDTTMSATNYEPATALIGTYFWRVRSLDLQGKTGVWSTSFSCSISELRHTITASSGAGGGITPAGQTPVVPGESQVFSITPDTGFHITEVVVDGTSQGNISAYTFDNVTGDHTISAGFAINTYTINASRTPDAGGSITALGDSTMNYGTSQTYTITPNAGYYISELIVDGSAVTIESNYSFTNIAADHTIQAVFKPALLVAASGNNSDGLTWSTAYHSIQTAATNASPGDEIWIKRGTYPITTQLSITKNVTLYGGFAGSESHPNQRDSELNPTVIDGQNLTRCFSITSSSPQVDGLIIYRGRITGGDPGRGGGVYIQSASPVFRNCSFLANAILSATVAYGGSVYIENGEPQFADCEFSENRVEATSVSDGGAIYVTNAGLVLTGCVFEDNYTDGDAHSLGGAIYSHSSSTMDITDTRFINNEARSDMADSCGGGAIYVDNSSVLDRCSFEGNQADGKQGRGGAIYNAGTPVIQNCVFVRNSTSGQNVSQGGAIANSGGSAQIINSTFANNEVHGALSAADNRGGAISNYNSNPIIRNCILWGNTAETNSQIYNNTGSSPTVEYCDIDESGYDGTNGNIRQDPLFGSTYHLRSDSPCIEKGTNASAPGVDTDNETRPYGTFVDMGADEFMDTDGDGLPDFWEDLYGFSNNTNDSGDDPDSDALPNLFEYQYDSNPLNGDSVVGVLNRGWWDQSGYHNANDNGVIVGRTDSNSYRGYFSFNLAGVSGTVSKAILRIEIAGYNSFDPSEPISMYDVLTSAATLENSGAGRTDIYSDLGSGSTYGNATITPGMVGTSIGVKLSDQAVSDLNAAAGGVYSIGFRALDWTGGDDETVDLSDGDEPRSHQLILFTD